MCCSRYVAAMSISRGYFNIPPRYHDVLVDVRTILFTPVTRTATKLTSAGVVQLKQVVRLSRVDKMRKKVISEVYIDRV